MSQNKINISLLLYFSVLIRIKAGKMSVSSGFHFLYDIGKIPSYMDVPIITVSSNIGQDFFNKARNSAAFDVMTKPEILVVTTGKACAAVN